MCPTVGCPRAGDLHTGPLGQDGPCQSSGIMDGLVRGLRETPDRRWSPSRGAGLFMGHWAPLVVPGRGRNPEEGWVIPAVCA